MPGMVVDELQHLILLKRKTRQKARLSDKLQRENDTLRGLDIDDLHGPPSLKQSHNNEEDTEELAALTPKERFIQITKLKDQIVYYNEKIQRLLVENDQLKEDKIVQRRRKQSLKVEAENYNWDLPDLSSLYFHLPRFKASKAKYRLAAEEKARALAERKKNSVILQIDSKTGKFTPVTVTAAQLRGSQGNAVDTVDSSESFSRRSSRATTAKSDGSVLIRSVQSTVKPDEIKSVPGVKIVRWSELFLLITYGITVAVVNGFREQASAGQTTPLLTAGFAVVICISFIVRRLWILRLLQELAIRRMKEKIADELSKFKTAIIQLIDKDRQVAEMQEAQVAAILAIENDSSKHVHIKRLNLLAIDQAVDDLTDLKKQLFISMDKFTNVIPALLVAMPATFKRKSRFWFTYLFISMVCLSCFIVGAWFAFKFGLDLDLEHLIYVDFKDYDTSAIASVIFAVLAICVMFIATTLLCDAAAMRSVNSTLKEAERLLNGPLRTEYQNPIAELLTQKLEPIRKQIQSSDLLLKLIREDDRFASVMKSAQGSALKDLAADADLPRLGRMSRVNTEEVSESDAVSSRDEEFEAVAPLPTVERSKDRDRNISPQKVRKSTSMPEPDHNSNQTRIQMPNRSSKMKKSNSMPSNTPSKSSQFNTRIRHEGSAAKKSLRSEAHSSSPSRVRPGNGTVNISRKSSRVIKSINTNRLPPVIVEAGSATDSPKPPVTPVSWLNPATWFSGSSEPATPTSPVRYNP
eukprot:GILJ01005338.1.p1 GENE.GILJ01005338.1~~GILJ01005338.1.p1  ORF type:complete len:765 (-),score=129.27 GILJ01005338.1:179-2428(-)